MQEVLWETEDCVSEDNSSSSDDKVETGGKLPSTICTIMSKIEN